MNTFHLGQTKVLKSKSYNFYDCISEGPTCAGTPDLIFICGGKLIGTGVITG